MTTPEHIYDIYDDLVKYSNTNIASLVCQAIKNEVLINFLFIQIKSKNITFLQLLWFIFKKYEPIREILNNSMIALIIASFDNTTTFFEIFKWYEEFGYNNDSISSNITTTLFIQATNYPTIKKYLTQIINQINNSDSVHNRTIFFIHDEVDIIKPYFSKNTEITNRMIIRCYQYNAINTLKQIQYKNKIKFFDMDWYLLSPMCFNAHMNDSKRNPYENEDFSIKLINYVCNTYHWDYLPTLIPNLTYPMWQRLILYFYMGYLNPMFVQVLFQQMKKHNIPFEKLKSTKYRLINSDYMEYIKNNNLFDLYNNNNRVIVANTSISDTALETSVVSAVSMLVIFGEKRIDALTEIVFESSLNMSKKYKEEIKYIDTLLKDDELGWDTKTIKTYENFKMILQRILDEAELSQDLVNKYNSFLPLAMHGVPECYQLRYLNQFLTIYKKLKIKIFLNEFKMIYDACLELKQHFIKNIRKDTLCKLDPSIPFTLPEEATIYDHFMNLIENSEKHDYHQEDQNNFWINEISDNKQIQNIVINMLKKYYVCIEEIIPILYKYYSFYATEEHLFLE